MIRKSKEEIEIEFSKAIDQATELENLAEDLSRIARGGMESALMILKNNWRGDTGGSIELAGRRTTAEIYSTADDLLRVAKTIRTTADLVYKAEKSAQYLCY